MKQLLPRLRQFWHSTDGPTATEYAIMLALMIVVMIGMVALIGIKARDKYWNPTTYGW